jgi:predicted Zn-dependent protease
MSETSRADARVGRDGAAERALTLADRVVDLVHTRAADAEVEVTVRRGQQALTRFATGFIHQNVASDVSHVLLRVALDDRNATTSLDGPADDEALGRVIDGVIEAARVRPPDPDWPGVAPEEAAPTVDHYDEATASATADQRASLVSGFVKAAGGLETAGFCSRTAPASASPPGRRSPSSTASAGRQRRTAAPAALRSRSRRLMARRSGLEPRRRRAPRATRETWNPAATRSCSSRAASPTCSCFWRTTG